MSGLHAAELYQSQVEGVKGTRPISAREAKENKKRPLVLRPQSPWNMKDEDLGPCNTRSLPFPFTCVLYAYKDVSRKLSLVPPAPRTRVHHQDLFKFHRLLSSGLLTLRSRGLLLLLSRSGTLGGRLSLRRGPQGLKIDSLDCVARQGIQNQN